VDVIHTLSALHTRMRIALAPLVAAIHAAAPAPVPAPLSAATTARAEPGVAAADVMFWWSMGVGEEGWVKTAAANANITRSKFGRAAAPSSNRPTVAFSPFQIPFVLNTDPAATAPLAQIDEPPYSSNQTAGFASLLPLRRLGGLIVPITVGGRTSGSSCCNPDTNSSCLADLSAFLTSPGRRAAAVAELVALAKAHNFSGWNFDEESAMPSAQRPTAPALTSGWRSFLQELATAMAALNPLATVSVDICGCGGDIPLENVSSVPDYMGMLPPDWKDIGVEAVSMCTYSNDSGKPYLQNGTRYDVFDERLACMSGSYGQSVARIGLGQGIPSWNSEIGELKRQLRHIEAANLTKLAVFIAPSLYSSVEWLDAIYDWVAARRAKARG
jgi:hypothetical protein